MTTTNNNEERMYTIVQVNGQWYWLSEYQPCAAVIFGNDALPNKQVNANVRRAMHEHGQLHYAAGRGDRMNLRGRGNYDGWKVS